MIYNLDLFVYGGKMQFESLLKFKSNRNSLNLNLIAQCVCSKKNTKKYQVLNIDLLRPTSYAPSFFLYVPPIASFACQDLYFCLESIPANKQTHKQQLFQIVTSPIQHKFQKQDKISKNSITYNKNNNKEKKKERKRKRKEG